MASENLLKSGIEYSFHSSSYSPTGTNDLSTGTPTAVDLTQGLSSGIAVDGSMNSDQVDLGATRPTDWLFTAAEEFFVAVAAGGSIDFFWSPSANSNVADGNPGNPDGVDGDYTGDGGGTVDESVKQMIYIGPLTTTDLIGVQKGVIGVLSTTLRYGQLIIVNKTSAVVCGTDDIETSVLMSGLLVEGQ